MQKQLKQLVRIARRITREERKLSALRMYERNGLDLDDVARMADSVGLETDDLLLMHPSQASLEKPIHVKGTPGRKTTTAELGFFAAERRERGLTWSDIFAEWKKLFPEDKRVTYVGIIRDAYRRHFGDKAKKHL